MEAKTQYNDYIGTAAADISDHISLDQFLAVRIINIDNYEVIGAQFFSSNIGGFSASIICIDKVRTIGNKTHVVQINFKDNLEIDEFFSLFKRFEVILYTDPEKYKDLEIDEKKIA